MKDKGEKIEMAGTPEEAMRAQFELCLVKVSEVMDGMIASASCTPFVVEGYAKSEGGQMFLITIAAIPPGYEIRQAVNYNQPSPQEIIKGH
jgi:hypothetical protein